MLSCVRMNGRRHWRCIRMAICLGVGKYSLCVQEWCHIWHVNFNKFPLIVWNDFKCLIMIPLVKAWIYVWCWIWCRKLRRYILDLITGADCAKWRQHPSLLVCNIAMYNSMASRTVYHNILFVVMCTPQNARISIDYQNEEWTFTCQWKRRCIQPHQTELYL